jgi:hypothetical protein
MESGLYRHYKGGLYQMIGIAEHTETHERVVVYVSLEASLPGPRLRVRPLSMWYDLMPWPDGCEHPRFVPVGDDMASRDNPFPGDNKPLVAREPSDDYKEHAGAGE